MPEASAEQEVVTGWTSLRRRKVVQWGLVYAAGAWGFLQGLEYVSETYHWPEQIRQFSVLALILGLPIALVLAWYHGDRGQQRVSGTEFAIVALLLLLGGAIFWQYEPTVDGSPAAAVPEPNNTDNTRADPRPSIAVLPFENRSRLDDDVFFVDGIHDDILTQLSKVSSLRVISRTSVEQFRDTKLPLKAIAELLGVTTILEGGVQRAGDRVRINVQLIDVATDSHIWAEKFDRDLTVDEVFAVQSEVAASIAGALETALTPAERARAQIVPTHDLAAWEAYQRGKQRMKGRTSEGLAEAEGHFRKAIELDPRFALAWVGVADTLAFQTFYSGRPRDAGLAEAQQAVDRALALDGNLAEAWASAGNIAHQRLQFEGAEQLLRQAIRLNPNYATAYHWLAMVLEELGRQDERLQMLERAVVLDPRSAVIHVNLSAARLSAARFDDALAAAEKAVELDPTMAAAYASVGAVHALIHGRYDTALPWLEKAAALDPRNPQLLAFVAEAYWEIGDDAQARRWLSRALTLGEGTTDTYAIAAILKLSEGDAPAARRYAERAAELDPWNMVYIRDFDLRSGDHATARRRYAEAFQQLFATERPVIDNDRDAFSAIELALVLQGAGDATRARVLLESGEKYLRAYPPIGNRGFYWVAAQATRGDTTSALETLREIARGGPRSQWRYYRDFDPALAPLRNEPRFKAAFADIERDMAKQRAALARAEP